MAKKTRRPNLPSETLERARRELQHSGELPERPAPSETRSAPSPVAQATPASKTRSPIDLSQEYAYVVSDLKNMAMLAAAFMAVLIVLSLFI